MKKSPRRQSADVRVVGPTSVAVLSHADIAKVYADDIRSYTLLVLNIAREISLRLRRLDAMLANVMLEIEDASEQVRGHVGASS